MQEIALTIHTFKMGSAKEAALKPLEEASEAREAAQQLQGLIDMEPMLVPSKELDDLIDSHREILADEIADTITACANLADRYGLDLQAAIDRVEARNRERGRYGCKDR
jgi:NTP pyrophosphatase (non-canonical NTP hydrolase)